MNMNRLSGILEKQLLSFIADGNTRDDEAQENENILTHLHQQQQQQQQLQQQSQQHQQQQHQQQQQNTDCSGKSTKVTACNLSSISTMTGNMTCTVSRITKVPSISLSRDNRNIDTSDTKRDNLFRLALVTFLQELHVSRWVLLRFSFYVSSSSSAKLPARTKKREDAN